MQDVELDNTETFVKSGLSDERLKYYLKLAGYAQTHDVLFVERNNIDQTWNLVLTPRGEFVTTASKRVT